MDRSNSPGMCMLKKYLEKTCVEINKESNTINTTEINPIADKILSMALSITLYSLFTIFFPIVCMGVWLLPGTGRQGISAPYLPTMVRPMIIFSISFAPS